MYVKTDAAARAPQDFVMLLFAARVTRATAAFRLSCTMERLRFDNLDAYLLVRNGNYLYKIPFRDGWAVLKLYYDSRPWIERLYKTFDNIVFQRQTSFMPKARLRNEQLSMQIWREAGFRVFDIYRDVCVEGLPEGGYALYEYVEGRHLHRLLPDASLSLEQRLDIYRRFLREWCRRHDLAVAHSEPRLIHENGDFKHVMERQGELVWFDFEVSFRSRSHVEDLVAREILAYLKSLAQFVPPPLFDLFFEETLRSYSRSEWLAHVCGVAFRNRNWLVRLARRLDYRFSRRARQPHSKYNLAIRVGKAMGIPVP